MGTKKSVRGELPRILDIFDSPIHGLTFCTGSPGATPENDLPGMIHRFAERIHFVHLRNVAVTGERDFHEVAHTDLAGNVDMGTVMEALVDIDDTGPLRPEHGRMIWGETGRSG